MPEEQEQRERRRSGVWAVVVGGSVAGTLDILFAISFGAYGGVRAVRVLQGVASGLLGMSAFSGGLKTAWLGLALHFAIAYTLTGLFLLASRRFRWLTEHPMVSGAVFGIAVFFVMRLVVLPLSAFPRPVRFEPVATTLDLLSHMFFVGVPIALAARLASADGRS